MWFENLGLHGAACSIVLDRADLFRKVLLSFFCFREGAQEPEFFTHILERKSKSQPFSGPKLYLDVSSRFLETPCEPVSTSYEARCRQTPRRD